MHAHKHDPESRMGLLTVNCCGYSVLWTAVCRAARADHPDYNCCCLHDGGGGKGKGAALERRRRTLPGASSLRCCCCTQLYVVCTDEARVCVVTVRSPHPPPQAVAAPCVRLSRRNACTQSCAAVVRGSRGIARRACRCASNGSFPTANVQRYRWSVDSCKLTRRF